KQSTAAGYRAGLLSGDPALVRRVWAVRRHLGLLVPTPVPAAMVAGLEADASVAAQRDRCRARRDVLAAAVRATGAPSVRVQARSAAGEPVEVRLLQRGGERDRHRAPLLVGLRKTAALNTLGDDGEPAGLPAGDAHEVVVELPGRMCGVLHLRWGAPTL